VYQRSSLNLYGKDKSKDDKQISIDSLLTMTCDYVIIACWPCVILISCLLQA